MMEQRNKLLFVCSENRIFLGLLMLPVIVATTIHACIWLMGYKADKNLKIDNPLLKRVLSLSAYETAKKVCSGFSAQIPDSRSSRVKRHRQSDRREYFYLILHSNQAGIRQVFSNRENLRVISSDMRNFIVFFSHSDPRG